VYGDDVSTGCAREICSCDGEDQDANARLIAAAPELLETLIAAERVLSRRSEDIEKDIESGWVPKPGSIARSALRIRESLLSQAAVCRAVIAKAVQS
jgi:hypothetical protein